MNFNKALLVISLLSTSSALSAAELKVAVAANFYKPLLQLVKQFEQNSEHTLTVSAGSTGSLYAQIKNGAPYEIFLAADQRRPAALIDEQQAVAGSRFTYAQGQLAFWSMQAGYSTQQDCRDAIENLQHITLANPKNAPYGAAAIEVLQALDLYPAAQKKVVEGHNIGQTYQYVSSGNVTAGFVALSQVYQDGKISEGSAWLVPSSLHTPLNQDAVLLKQGQSNPAAHAFIDFLRSSEAQQTIRAFGYKI